MNVEFWKTVHAVAAIYSSAQRAGGGCTEGMNMDAHAFFALNLNVVTRAVQNQKRETGLGHGAERPTPRHGRIRQCACGLWI